MNRHDSIRRISEGDTIWDVAVIGGGSSGFGVALDALSRGLSVVLLDKSDFAKGTSSRSTKLLHGGVRYLAQGHIGLVMEALRERGRLLQNAPHLTYNQPFIIPVYTLFDKLQYSVGLKLYDWMAGKWRLGKSHFINKSETMRRLPGVKPDGLKGGVVYHDGQFDDARMIIALAQTCTEMGGCVANYTRVIKLLKNSHGRINGLVARDELTRTQYPVKARMVINATGVFADKILQLDQPGVPRSIQPSQGIHLVIDKSFLGGDAALMIPKTPDGRVLFAVPWKDKLVLGTTDTLKEKAKLEPQALASEIDFVLDTAGAYMVKPPTRNDVLSVFAGLRPLAAPKAGSTKTKAISRSHKVIVSDSHLVSLTGGKWTTFRQMAEDTVDHFTKVTGKQTPKSGTATLHLHGYTNHPEVGHMGVYGSDAAHIKALAAENPSLKELLHPKHPYLLAEVVWIVRSEMAVTVEDVLSRRLRLLMLDAKAALEAASKVAKVMAQEQGHDAEWVESQLESFFKIAHKYLIPNKHGKG